MKQLGATMGQMSPLSDLIALACGGSGGTLAKDLFSGTGAVTSHTPDVGGPWRLDYGTVPTLDGNGNLTSSSGNDFVISLPTSASDVTVSVATTTRNGGGQNSSLMQGLMFRQSDTSNYWLVSLWCNSFSQITLQKQVAGAWSTVASVGLGLPGQGFTSLGPLKVVCSGSTITVSLGGTQKLQVSDSFNQTATRHGLCRRDPSNTASDDSGADTQTSFLVTAP